MSSLVRLRPRYDRHSPLAPEIVRTRLRAALSAPDAVCRGSVDEDKLEVMVRGEHHFWTPELRAFIEPAVGGGSTLAGVFGPAPAVWTMFTVIYIHLAFICVAAAVYAMAQLTLGARPTALWAVPICVALALLVRLAAHLGERLGHDDLETIEAFVDRAVDARAPSSPGS